MRTPAPSATRANQLSAWGVHLFTASGIVWGVLALLAIIQGRWIPALIWMGAATMVDASDGTLARRFRVKEVLPGFDGALLDNMVDYFTYVIVPALFLYQGQLFPPRLALLGVIIITLASAYQFAQADAKTDDNYFKGFPSYWNVVAFYLFVMALPAWLNFLLVVLLGALVFVPIKYIYHSRTAAFRRLTMFLTLLWGGAVVALLLSYPQHPTWLVWASFLYVVYYAATSLYLMHRARAYLIKEGH
ncbi:MAG: hypothetical protein KC418_06510 [Anaerolineales bacterium]|nr:hypothetical protein [Anaerolineales bacterium]MCB8952936.1 hypothetical protein [Ardenticatenales bacterium]